MPAAPATAPSPPTAPSPSTAAGPGVIRTDIVRTGVVRGGTVELDPGPPLPEGARVTVAAGGDGADGSPYAGESAEEAAWWRRTVAETERMRRLPRAADGPA